LIEIAHRLLHRLNIGADLPAVRGQVDHTALDKPFVHHINPRLEIGFSLNVFFHLYPGDPLDNDPLASIHFPNHPQDQSGHAHRIKIALFGIFGFRPFLSD
jgi:hypothetical protein